MYLNLEKERKKMNIIEVSRKRDSILKFENKVYCPLCNKMQYSSVDKLYVTAYEKCIVCSTPEEVEINGANILEIIGTWN